MLLTGQVKGQKKTAIFRHRFRRKIFHIYVLLFASTLTAQRRNYLFKNFCFTYDVEVLCSYLSTRYVDVYTKYGAATKQTWPCGVVLSLCSVVCITVG